MGERAMKTKLLIVVAIALLAAEALHAQEQKRRPQGQPGGGTSMIENPLLAKDDAEKKALAALEEARKGERFANVSTEDGRLLRQLTEAVNAQRVVELGTSTGESGIWFAIALRKTGGHLYTHDIDPERLQVARRSFESAGVSDLITIIEGDAHETIKQHTEPVDIVFLDADKEGYLDYLEKILPRVRPGGLIIAHNMRRPEPDPRYIKAITTNPDLDTSFVLMEGAGIGVTLKKR
jgi:predicted O-methyltransferase YrrM